MKSSATLKIVLDPYDKSEKRPLKLRVTFNRESRYYSLDSSAKLTNAEFANDKLKVYKDAMSEVKKANDIAIAVVDNLGKDFTFREFRRRYKNEVYGEARDYRDFKSFAESYIQGLKEESTKKLYNTSVNWVEKVHKGVKLETVDEEFVDEMVDKMKINNVSENTIRLYCRQLKAIFQRAIDDGIVKVKNPFSKYAKASTGRELCGLTDEEFAKLNSYKPKTPQTSFGKDFFLLSFALAGANIGDILRLKNANIKGNNIEFVRHKTQERNPKPIVIQLIPLITRTLQKYGRIDRLNPDYYILPYLHDCKNATSAHNKIHDVIKKINDGLAIICKELGIRKITTYDARHTYATLARDNGGFGDNQISKLLGHASVKTTSIYLNKLSAKVLAENSAMVNQMLDPKDSSKDPVDLKGQLEGLFERFGKEEVLKALETANGK